MNKTLANRVKKLESFIATKSIVTLERYDILVNGVSILPCPLRPYQREYFDQTVHSKCNKSFIFWSRRSGKSFTTFIALIYMCLRDDNSNAYQLFPHQLMVDRIIWSGVFIDKVNNKNYKFIKLLPKSICVPNNTTKTLKFYNGSTLKLIGTNEPDDIRGVTSGVIAVSEYAFCKEYLLPVLTPIIVASGGKLMLESTPNGRNFAWKQFHEFKDDASWWCDYQTCETLIDDAGNRFITKDDIRDAVANGLSESMISQEFFCLPIIDENDIIYGSELKQVKYLERVYEPQLQIHFAFDLGINDKTAIVGYQIREDGNINIVWCYQNNNKPYEYYINHIFNTFRNRRIGQFVLPHDAKKRSGQSSSLETVADHFESFNCDVIRLKRPKSMGGFIALVKAYIGGIIIQKDCSDLIDALEGYRYDVNRKPVHDHNSHYASAFGYAIMSIYYGHHYGVHNQEIRHYAA